MKLVVEPVFVYNYNVNLAVKFSYPTWTGVKTGVFNARVRAINYLSERTLFSLFRTRWFWSTFPYQKIRNKRYVQNGVMTNLCVTFPGGEVSGSPCSSPGPYWSEVGLVPYWSKPTPARFSQFPSEKQIPELRPEWAHPDHMRRRNQRRETARTQLRYHYQFLSWNKEYSWTEIHGSRDISFPEFLDWWSRVGSSTPGSNLGFRAGFPPGVPLL